jgi:hypothetical protein
MDSLQKSYYIYKIAGFKLVLNFFFYFINKAKYKDINTQSCIIL